MEVIWANNPPQKGCNPAKKREEATAVKKESKVIWLGVTLVLANFLVIF